MAETATKAAAEEAGQTIILALEAEEIHEAVQEETQGAVQEETHEAAQEEIQGAVQEETHEAVQAVAQVAAQEEIHEAAQAVAQVAVQEGTPVAVQEAIHVVAQEEIHEAVQVAVSQGSTVITVHQRDLDEAVVAAETIRVNLVTLTSETGFEILLRPHSVYG